MWTRSLARIARKTKEEISRQNRSARGVIRSDRKRVDIGSDILAGPTLNDGCKTESSYVVYIL